jgi:magnesium-transporting ATPase (P-type)
MYSIIYFILILECGDIVETKCDMPFPCDMVLLNTQTEDSVCYITTANLDGETNLKPRSVPHSMPEIKEIEQLATMTAVIKCDKPNMELYEFKGKIEIDQAE